MRNILEQSHLNKLDPWVSSKKQEEEYSISSSNFLELILPILENGSPVRFLAKGESMAPFICHGDILTIAPLDHRAPFLGEVVAYTYPQSSQLIIHRVVKKSGRIYLIKGDNSSDTLEDPILLENILGRVIHVDHKGGSFKLGLGPERILIAFLSHHHSLFPLVTRLVQIKRWLWH
jgi:signal peptidase I